MNISQLKAEVSRLEGEIANSDREIARLRAELPVDIESAKAEAVAKVKVERAAQTNEIIDFAEKYSSSPGEFNGLMMTSLVAGDSAVDFKAALLDVILARQQAQPTSRRAEYGEEGGRVKDERSGKIDQLRAKLSEETDPKNRTTLIKEIRVLRNTKMNIK